jgi:hypothetical protein
MSLTTHGKKTNNNKSGAATADKQRKRKEAEERQTQYSSLTLLQKLDRLVQNGLPQKERVKLLLRVKKEGLILSNDMREKLNL